MRSRELRYEDFLAVQRQRRAGADLAERLQRAALAARAAGIKPTLTGTTYSSRVDHTRSSTRQRG